MPSLTAARVAGLRAAGAAPAGPCGRSQPLAASAAATRTAITTRMGSPAVAQLAQLHEHGARIGTLADVRKRFPQPRDDRGILQPQERVDALLLAGGGHRRSGRVVVCGLAVRHLTML